MIRLQRVYDEHGSDPRAGTRFLVDRLWPRGRKKADLHLDGWLREVAPSTELRQWYGHHVERFDEFRSRYIRELDAHPDAWEPLLEAARHGRITLLHGARDTEHNNATVLKDYLEARLKRPSRTKPRRTVH
ncbi:DUF488 domain-containing protein [Corallococcus exiguus]|uniref:DUF488 family protein n=1 Tax=Corallococcus exiguus TaxID=83462 RepID=A0A7X5BR36_9BACT|nr:DUF488 family protein [Corallococcus exiguus]NBC38623.1 DUF488 family protein [Corallococcus exiguus]TNV62039.1 DUF488 family protein [Corallococcus exiguus]